MTPTADTGRPTAELTAEEARLLVLRSQLLDSPALVPLPPAGADQLADGLISGLAAIQLDTISVLARSHELIAYSRLGPVGRPAVESAYWGHRPAAAFEYWGHATCLLPVAAWPYFAFRRRAERESGRGRGNLPDTVIANVRAMLKEQPVTATELGGARKSGAWFDRSQEKAAAEWLYWIGDAVCTDRRHWKRVYDLPDRALPTDVLGVEPSEQECLRYLVTQAVRALGVATRHDIADFYRLALWQVDSGLRDSDCRQVQVAGWDAPAWVAPGISPAAGPVAHRPVLLSPFDSLIWERKRMKRLFGFSILLEAYLPKHKRVHGYFSMPLLTGGDLVGHVDPAKEGKVLIARQLSLTGPQHVEAMSQALLEAASWVGCDAVVIERADPAGVAGPLNRALGNSR